jgi:hypothetical protein
MRIYHAVLAINVEMRAKPGKKISIYPYDRKGITAMTKKKYWL